MRIVTLIKAVPDLDRMEFDPATNIARRAGVPLFLNPFDARAALVAPTLAGPGDTTIVLTVGPPEARGPLAEALAMGSGSAVLVSDPRLAGSDTFVTARVLAATLRPLAPDLLLAGRWSTDSSTGQLPSQLAEVLGLPMVSGARRIGRRGERGFDVVGETEEGWARYEVEAPCVITVGEKIAKMRSPSPEARDEAERRGPVVRTLEDLGLPAKDVGLEGSPTRVVRLRNEEPERDPHVFDSGSPGERVRGAAARVRELLGRPRPVPPAHRTPPSEPGPVGEVLVFVSRPDGGIDPESLPLLSEVLRLPEPYYPAAVGFGPLTDRDRQRLGEAGAAAAYWRSAENRWRSAEGLAPSVSEILGARPAAAGALFVGSSWSRELAGRVSVRSKVGLTGDAVGFTADGRGSLIFEKPSFGGGQIAEVVSRSRPALATVRPGSFALARLERDGSTIPVASSPLADAPERVRRTEAGVERDPRFGDLEKARVVVVVGLGIGGPDAIPEILDATRSLGAALGATRKVVDAGWLPPQLQVGLTGRSVAPDLYLAVGASGKANHLVGAKRARVVVGINTDRSEPLFSRVDVGVVGEWRDVLAPLVDALARGPS
jgi:electron transfer flavoprotein alpha subunit